MQIKRHQQNHLQGTAANKTTSAELIGSLSTVIV